MRRRVVMSSGDWIDPANLFLGLSSTNEAVVWLDSGMHADVGMSYVGVANRWLTASVHAGTVTESAARHEAVTRTATVFEALEADLDRGVALPEGAPSGFRLGWVGWFGYELHAQTLDTRARQSPHPDAAWLFVDRVAAFDHAERTVTLMALGEDALVEWRDHVDAAVSREHRPASLPSRVSTPRWRDDRASYIAKVEACQRAIHAGDAYQLCLTTEAMVDGAIDPVATYLALRESSPTHHGAFLRVEGVSLLSASPEQFLRIDPDGVVETRPIKGTRPRGATPDEDAALRDELRASDKEQAENLMIVDLMRNDLGRVCEVGSVTVPSLFAVESYAHVHQLVSTVRGVLASGASRLDAIAACFPAGSMTGAPKHSAVSILDALEQRPRGLYSGAFGYLGFDGAVDLAMVIRSIVVDEHGASVGAGGGITALSVPREEHAEARLKAEALLRVLAGSESPGRYAR